METYYLKSEDIIKFYERISQEYDLYVPVRNSPGVTKECTHGFSLATDDFVLKKFFKVPKEDIVFNEYRCVEPIRVFFTHFKEEVCEYFKEDIMPNARKEKPVAVCGVKNCDIFSLKIQDSVFLGQEEDPLYKKRRDEALLISGDCPGFKEVCFCRAFDINPYPTEGFDFNLSCLNNVYLLDVATDKARKIADSMGSFLTPANMGQLAGRTAKRESVLKKLDEHLSHHKIPKKEYLKEIVVSGYNSKIWSEQMLTCVECGGCVFICDTCHCFLLSDEEISGETKKLRVWDGCLFKNFTKVAGGANPLKMRYMRLRNRYLKKFDFFIDNLGYQACCGCGRCIEVCPGNIDIRHILRALYEEKYLPAS